jgi:hypothetical protein
MSSTIGSDGVDSESNAGIDRLLVAFFQSEMPAAALLKPPATVITQPRMAWRSRTGQIALAASILLLLLGQGFLFRAATFPPPNDRGNDQGAVEARNRHALTPLSAQPSAGQDFPKALHYKEK